jgi:hypothetical protein
MDLRTVAITSKCIKTTAYFVDEEEVYLREETAVTCPAANSVVKHLDPIRISLTNSLSGYPTSLPAMRYQMLPLSQDRSKHHRSNAEENSQHKRSNTQNEHSTLYLRF